MSTESSLDRFLRNRALLGLGLVGKRSYWIQNVVGIGLTLFGLGMIAAPTFGADPGIVAGGIGPMIAGVLNVIMAQAMRRRLGASMNNEWRLTSEAKAFLFRLVKERLGWLDGGGLHMDCMGPMMVFTVSGKRARREIRHLNWSLEGFGFGTPSSRKMNPELLEILDVAAEQFNRVQGILSMASTPPSRIQAGANAAADEAMAAILHEAAMMDKYPESASTSRRKIESHLFALKELGDRLEALVTRQQTLTDKVGYTSSMDAVLEELRLEELARSELQASEPERQNLNNL